MSVVLALADQRVRERLERGDTLRDDGFFEAQPGDRSAGAESVEGVLLATQRDHEEKKLPFYANLLANLAFDTTYDRAEANLLIRLGRELSYRQLLLLSLWGGRRLDNAHRTEDYREERNFSQPLIGTLQEAYDLYLRGLLKRPRVAGAYRREAGHRLT